MLFLMSCKTNQLTIKISELHDFPQLYHNTSEPKLLYCVMLLFHAIHLFLIGRARSVFYIMAMGYYQDRFWNKLQKLNTSCEFTGL